MKTQMIAAALCGLAWISFWSTLLAQDPAAEGARVDQPVLEIHDVQRLAERLSGLTNPLVTSQEEGSLEERVDRGTKMLPGAISRFVVPPLSEGESVMVLEGGRILFQGRPSQQEWVRRFIRVHEEGDLGMVFMRSWLFKLPASQCRELGVGHRPLILESDAAAAFLDRCRKIEGAKETRMPKCINWPIVNESSMLTGSHYSYVKEYELRQMMLHGKNPLSVPVLESVFDGTQLIWGFALAGPESYDFWFELTVTELERPFKTVMTDQGEIGAPELTRITAESRVVAPRAATIVLPSPEKDGYQHVVVVSIGELDDVMNERAGTEEENSADTSEGG